MRSAAAVAGAQGELPGDAPTQGGGQNHRAIAPVITGTPWTLTGSPLTVVGHKMYAPKGVAALYVRAGTALEPVIYGAGRNAGCVRVPRMSPPSLRSAPRSTWPGMTWPAARKADSRACGIGCTAGGCGAAWTGRATKAIGCPTRSTSALPGCMVTNCSPPLLNCCAHTSTNIISTPIIDLGTPRRPPQASGSYCIWSLPGTPTPRIRGERSGSQWIEVISVLSQRGSAGLSFVPVIWLCLRTRS